MKRILSIFLSSSLVLTQLSACAPKSPPHAFESRVMEDEGDDDDGGDEGGDEDGGEGFDSDTVGTDSDGNPVPDKPEGSSSGKPVNSGGVYSGEPKAGERMTYWSTEGERYSGVVKEVNDGGNSVVLDEKTIRREEEPVGRIASVKDGKPMTKESEEFFKDKGNGLKKNGPDPESPTEPKKGVVTKDSLTRPSSLSALRGFMKNERTAISDALSKQSKSGQGARTVSHKESQKYASTHNSGIGGLAGVLPGAKSAGKSPALKTPATSPLGAAMRSTQRYIDYVETEGNGDPKLTGLARRTLKKADELAQEGDPAGADKRRKAAQDLADSASCQGCKPPPAGEPPSDPEHFPTFDENKERGYAYDAGTRMYDAANDLDDEGLPGIADATRSTAAKFLNVALGLARISNLLDIPLSVAEAFGGVTVEIDDDGNPRVRDATKTERAIAAVNLGIIAGATVLGAGIGGVFAAGVIGKIGNVIRGAEKGHALEKAALEAAEKGLVGAEKEALEKAAAKAAEKDAEQIAKEASEAAGAIDPKQRPQLPKDTEPLKFGNETKIRSQMKQRGWTEQEIREALQTEGTPAMGKKGQATRYTHPRTGKAVTVDNATGEVFMVGGENYLYD